jgi:predicted AAA+ superfamily ATPase
LTGRKGKRLILDEIHRLDNPSEILKIAADHYPEVKIIATGSSTLGAVQNLKTHYRTQKRSMANTTFAARNG